MTKRNIGIFDVGDLDLPDFSTGSVKSQEESKIKLIHNEISRLNALIAKKENDIISLQNEIEVVKESSYKKGFNEGYEKSKQDLTESFELSFSDKIDSYSQKIETTISDLVKAKQGVVIESEKSVLDLIFAMVKKIVHHEITLDKEMIIDVVKNALPAVDSALTLGIIAHPDDVVVLKEFENLWLPLTMKRESVSYIEKESIKPGGLLVSTNLGTVNSQIDKVIENLESAIVQQQKCVR